MTKDRKLSVFLCHSSNDKPVVRELYQRLNNEGWIDPWLDEEKLYPGQDWDLEIEKAVEAADAVIVFLSNNSVSKEGYVQRELRFVLRIADYKPEGTVFVIPMRLDDCPRPRRLSMWQDVDYFPENRKNWAYKRLLNSLKVRAEKLHITTVVQSDERIQRAKGESPNVEYVEIDDNDFAFQSNVDGVKIFTFAEMPFVRIPAGKFLMGSKNDNKLAYDDERPQHTLELPDFFMARFPVTNADYGRYKGSDFKIPKYKNDHPVVKVSWHDAMEFVGWLNETARDELPEGNVFALPTEAQWEKAARGEYGNEWPWGNEFDKNRCNSGEVGKRDTTPVDAYPAGASPYGMLDTVGNVWEWTHSLYKEYPYNLDDGRENEGKSESRVLRGGSFNYYREVVRCVSRNYGDPNNRYDHFIGFRVCVSQNSLYAGNVDWR